MIRFILLLLIGYLLWSLFRILSRVWGSGRGTRDGGVGGEKPKQPSAGKKFRDVRDADFEDLGPDDQGR